MNCLFVGATRKKTKMHYLPLQSILRKSLILPRITHLSKEAGIVTGHRVKIIPTQTFALDAFVWKVHVRQHLMPHNGELATTIQTFGHPKCNTHPQGHVSQSTFESITYLSTPHRELYQASYTLQEASSSSSSIWTFEVPLTEPHTLEWHRHYLLQGIGEQDGLVTPDGGC